MTGDEAKEILQQIGWNREDTLFMSFHFTPEQFANFSRAYGCVTFEQTPEEFISELCCFVTIEREREKKDERRNLCGMDGD